MTQTCKDLEQRSGEEVLMQIPGQKQAMLNKCLSLSWAPAWAPEQLDLLVWCTREAKCVLQLDQELWHMSLGTETQGTGAERFA